MESVLIMGADEFFGLALCEYMIKEGLQVDLTFMEDDTEQKKQLREERMMWLGRNDLVRVVNPTMREDVYDLIYIQKEKDNEIQEGIKANIGMFRLLYPSDHTSTSKQENQRKGQSILLPAMYGPWTLEEDKRYVNDGAYYVEDVAEALFQWSLTDNHRQEGIHMLMPQRKTEPAEAKEKILSWERQNSTIFDKNQE
ncbi:nad binding enzyme [Bacillus sp. NPDC077027]|uniref:nad binding enzyme n=1 Tax=Bacillus sp. NPDC077027 TaxID=3390548 RepID=UPI003D00B142